MASYAVPRDRVPAIYAGGVVPRCLHFLHTCRPVCPLGVFFTLEAAEIEGRITGGLSDGSCTGRFVYRELRGEWPLRKLRVGLKDRLFVMRAAVCCQVTDASEAFRFLVEYRCTTAIQREKNMFTGEVSPVLKEKLATVYSVPFSA